MKNAIKKVVIGSVAVVLFAVVAVAAFLIIQEKSMPVKEEKVIANLEWGMTVLEAKIAMAQEGHMDAKVIEMGPNTVVQYPIRDYQGIEGANCELLLMFVDGKLNNGYYYFRTESDMSCANSVEMLDKLQLMFAKRYERSCKESISQEYHEDRLPEDPDYSRYFVGEKSFVFVNRSPEHLDVRFEDLNQPNMPELIEALKLLDATDAPSPTGYFSKRGEQDK